MHSINSSAGAFHCLRLMYEEAPHLYCLSLTFQDGVLYCLKYAPVQLTITRNLGVSRVAVHCWELCSVCPHLGFGPWSFSIVTESGKQDMNLILPRDRVHGTSYWWYSLSVGLCRPAYFWCKPLLDSLCSQRCNSNLVTSLHSFLLCFIQFI